MSTRTTRGSLPEYGYKAASSGLRRGIALVQGSTNVTAVKGTALGQGKYRGVQIDEGTLPDGSANYGQDAAHPAEMVNAQKEGIVLALCAPNTSPTMGGQAISDMNGNFIVRTPYSFSAFVYGQFDESATVGANASLVAMELQPQYIEVVRNVSDFVSTIGNVTKYTNFGGTISTNPVPKYLVRTTGEKIANLAINLTTAPGGADTVAVTVYKSSDNGSTFGATTLTCTATGAAKTASDTTHVVSLTAGDLLAIYVASSNVTAANLTVSFDVI